MLTNIPETIVFTYILRFFSKFLCRHKSRKQIVLLIFWSLPQGPVKIHTENTSIYTLHCQQKPPRPKNTIFFFCFFVVVLFYILYVVIYYSSLLMPHYWKLFIFVVLLRKVNFKPCCKSSASPVHLKAMKPLS